MKKSIGVLLTIITLFLVGCNSDDNIIIEEKQNEIKELKNKIVELEDTVKEQQKVIDEYDKEFSYLLSFTDGELKAYERFYEDKDVQHLADYSPEKIVLLYLHSIVIDDVEAIYSLVYTDGTLPDLSTFTQKYYSEGLHKKGSETTLDFRYYDLITVREDNNTENTVAVEIGVNFGLFHATEILELKKEDGIWKMNILHLL
ncbi:hypothetical protein [Alkalihalobacterium elongatum]|uniref:hypothetical protein n=1 Tax=Alkalihalobacterium elongatum TaxID=2675466 RepID=UPI001C1FB8F6|nr:hypothetical protein [Alkalihalobacterium elongatum]